MTKHLFDVLDCKDESNYDVFYDIFIKFGQHRHLAIEITIVRVEGEFEAVGLFNCAD